MTGRMNRSMMVSSVLPCACSLKLRDYLCMDFNNWWAMFDCGSSKPRTMEVRLGNVVGERTYTNPIASSRMWLRIFKFKLGEVKCPVQFLVTLAICQHLWPPHQARQTGCCCRCRAALRSHRHHCYTSPDMQEVSHCCQAGLGASTCSATDG